MYRTLRSIAGMGILALGSLLGVGTASVRAQGYITPMPRYITPMPRYSAPMPRYSAPAPRYSAPAPRYSAPAPRYADLIDGAPADAIPADTSWPEEGYDAYTQALSGG